MATATKIVCPTPTLTTGLMSVVPLEVSEAVPRFGTVVGATSVKLTALPVKVLPTLSVVLACTVYVPAVCDDQLGRPVFFVHVTGVSPLVEPGVRVVVRLKMPACHAEVVEFQ